MILKIIGWTLLGIIILIIILMNFPVKVHISYIEKKFRAEVKFLFLTLYPRKKKKGKEDEEKEDEVIIADDDNEASAEDGQSPAPAAEEGAEETAPSPQDSEEADASDTGAGSEDIPADTEEAAENEAETPAQEGTPCDEESGKADEKDDKKDEKPAKRPAKKQHLADKVIALCDDLSEKKDAVFLIIDLVWDHTVKFLKKIYCTDVYVDLEIANEDCSKAAVIYGAVSAAVYNLIGFMKSISRFDVKYTAIDCIYNTPSDKSRYDVEITIRMRPQSLLNLLYILILRFLFHFRKYKPILSLITKKK